MSREVGSRADHTLNDARTPLSRGRLIDGAGKLPDLWSRLAAEGRLWSSRRTRILVLVSVTAILLLFAALGPATGARPTMRATLATVVTTLSLAATAVFLVHFRRQRRVGDLLLLTASLTLGLLFLTVIAAPSVLKQRPAGELAAAALWGQPLVATLLVAAALAPARRLVARPRAATAMAGLVSLMLVSTAELAGLLTHQDLLGRHAVSADTLATGHPLDLVLIIATVTLFVLAAMGFALEPNAGSRRVRLPLTVSAIFMGAASYAHAVGAITLAEISSGALLRVASAALLLGAALCGELEAGRARIGAVALAERRRVARDLHDGLAQDLALIAAHAPRIAAEIGDEHPVVIAARRALAISRDAISDLSDPAGASVQESLEAVAQELRERFGIAIVVDAQLDQDPPPDVRAHLTRIAREAIANAARHGQAMNVLVSLTQEPNGILLRIVDDGHGMRVAGSGAVPEGFGLRSMRERATALGGYLSVRDVRHGGTELEVFLP